MLCHSVYTQARLVWHTRAPGILVVACYLCGASWCGTRKSRVTSRTGTRPPSSSQWRFAVQVHVRPRLHFHDKPKGGRPSGRRTGRRPSVNLGRPRGSPRWRVGYFSRRCRGASAKATSVLRLRMTPARSLATERAAAAHPGCRRSGLRSCHTVAEAMLKRRRWPPPAAPQGTRHIDIDEHRQPLNFRGR